MSEISRSEYRAVINFLTLEKQLANNIYERLVSVYGDSAPSYSTVTRWPNIAWRWHLSWTASWSDHWCLLPCCRKAGDGRSTTKSPGDSHRSGHFTWQHLEYFAWTFGSVPDGPHVFWHPFNTPQEFYLTGINELFDKCQKCIDVKGDYIKK